MSANMNPLLGSSTEKSGPSTLDATADNAIMDLEARGLPVKPLPPE